MPSALNTALLFLIDTLFNLYIFILVARAVLVYVGSHYYDPLTQFIVKCTDFLVKPIRKIVPNIGRIECATLLLLIVFEMVKLLCVAFLSIGAPSMLGLIVWALGDTLSYFMTFFTYVVVIYAILSWIQPNAPMMHILYQCASLVMRPIQRFIPPIGGMDLSPLFALVLLQLMMILFVNPIIAYGQMMAY